MGQNMFHELGKAEAAGRLIYRQDPSQAFTYVNEGRIAYPKNYPTEFMYDSGKRKQNRERMIAT